MTRRRLAQERYLGYPLEFVDGKVRTSDRAGHIREQILQTLFTNPSERLFRPSFGAGAEQAVFAPNDAGLATLTAQRLTAALSDVLAGEVDPKTLEVTVTNDEEVLNVRVSYQIAALNQREQHDFVVPGSSNG